MILDTLLINGICYTMEFEGDVVDAIGIKEGKIVFTGSNEEAKKFKTKKTIDLEKRTVIPGMTDAHMHLYAYCQNKTQVDLQNTRSIDDVIKLMKEKAKNMPKDTWIKGVNFDQSKFSENRFPTRYDLDKISTEHPIVIKRVCLHAAVVNSKALKLANITKGYDHGSGGIIESFENGEPNGILKEQSTKLIDNIMPDPLADEETKNKIMLKSFKELSSVGVTAIHTYAAKIWNYNEDLELYRKFENKNQLPIRVTVCLDQLFEKEKLSAEDHINPYRLVQHGAYKIFTDGSMGSRSAALKEPYSDEPDNYGFTVCTQDELNKKVFTAYERGLQPAIHAIGDKALDMTLTAIENCLDKSDKVSELPFRIIHVQLINAELLERMKKLPVILDIQPPFLSSDLYWLEDRLGSERTKNSYTLKTFIKEGFIQTGGSDSPVEPFNPLLGIFAAVNRTDLNSYPEGGFYPDEKLSVYEALSLYTKNPHFATGQQDVLGTISKGKFADLIVLDKNIFDIDTKDILSIKVIKTFLAGLEVFGN